MRITKRGTPPTEQCWLGVCGYCGSEAEALQHEMTHIQDDPREGTLFSWEKCPVCKAGGAKGYGGMLFQPAKKR